MGSAKESTHKPTFNDQPADYRVDGEEMFGVGGVVIPSGDSLTNAKGDYVVIPTTWGFISAPESKAKEIRSRITPPELEPHAPKTRHRR